MGCCPSWTDSCMGFPQASDLQVLLQHGTPMDNSPPRAAAPVQVILLLGFSMGCDLFHATSTAARGDLLLVATHRLQGDSLLHHGLLLGCRKTTVQCLEHLLPSFCTDLDACRAASLKFPHCSVSCIFAAFFLFLNLLSQRHIQYSLLAQPWPARGWV